MTPAVRRRRRLAVLLGAVAGGADAIGYITLFGLFTAHMTGNTDGFAVALGHGAALQALRHISPIPVFVIGVAAGVLVAHIAAQRGVRANHAGPLVLEGFALAAFWAIAPRARLGASDAPTLAYFGVAALPAFAMGLQAAALRRIGDHAIRTTFITGMLCVLAEQGVAWWLQRRARRRAGREATARERSTAARARVAFAIWAAYVTGGLVCTIAERLVHYASLALPLAGIAVALAVDWRAARASPDVA